MDVIEFISARLESAIRNLIQHSSTASFGRNSYRKLARQLFRVTFAIFRDRLQSCHHVAGPSWVQWRKPAGFSYEGILKENHDSSRLDSYCLYLNSIHSDSAASSPLNSIRFRVQLLRFVRIINKLWIRLTHFFELIRTLLDYPTKIRVWTCGG